MQPASPLLLSPSRSALAPVRFATSSSVAVVRCARSDAPARSSPTPRPDPHPLHPRKEPMNTTFGSLYKQAKDSGAFNTVLPDGDFVLEIVRVNASKTANGDD